MSVRLATLILMLLLAACATAPTDVSANATPNPVQAYVDANASQATAVAAVATAQFYSGQLTATVEASDALATAQAESLWATQQAVNISGTQRAWSATATSDSALATSVASATSSAVAVQAAWTQRAVSITSTADTASVQAYATQMYSRSQESELQVERDQSMNNVRAAAPWGLLTFVVLFTALIAYRWSKVRIIHRDARGDAPLLLNTIDGIAFDADRHPVSTAGLLRADLQRLPQLNAEAHTQTTARDQMLDLATRAPDLPRLKDGFSLANPLANSTPKIQVISEEQAQPWLKDVLPHLMQDAIDAEIVSEEGEHKS